MYHQTYLLYKSLIILLIVLSTAISASAQPAEKIVKVIVAPDHSNWEYKTGEPVSFSISVLKDGNLLKDAAIAYQIMPEKMQPIISKSAVLKTGQIKVAGGTMKVPGFLRCTATATVDGRTYSGLATAGFEPLSIKPTASMPDDFDTFWKSALADASKLPMEVSMQLIPEKSTGNVNTYHVSFQSYQKYTRVYGVLCVPKAKGKYPAILKVPGAGARPHTGDVATAEKGFITLDISIHGIPVNLDPVVYQNLMTGALRNYMTYGLDDKDQYYYKRVYLGCVRANDFLVSLPEFDGKNLAVMGGSQGGALSIVTAALDSRVKCLVAYHPALSDLTGYLHGRAGGWPHLFDQHQAKYHNKPDKVATSGYYDVVNFAKRLKVPGFYTWGFNDETCPPTSMYAFYNTIKAPKKLYLALEVGHWSYPEQNEEANNWLFGQLK
ncbi:MAG: acetylxylan esterase [Pedobacter sp.]|nr:MAG: acetylxylan esterase [Pedobacter sp.]